VSDSTVGGDNEESMNGDDHDLLRRYAHEGSQAAFAELVRRHVNLVYSAARRQVGSSALAEEVTQSVFLDLARNAPRIKPPAPLVAWLHLVTRRTAIDVIRHETRRLAREKSAMELSPMNQSPSIWNEVEPLLDEALAKLPEKDRTAVLLRFFENRTLHEVGAALGTSDDAAQKRLGRAMDRLRRFFSKRGIAIGASGLVTELSAHAIETAPFSLGATISSATSSSVVALKTAQFLAMTTLQKSACVAVLAIATGFGIYEAAVAQQQRNTLADLGERKEHLAAEIRQTRSENDAANRRLAKAETEIDAILGASKSPTRASETAALEQMKTWLANVDRLKDALRRRPELAIPELAFVDEKTWFEIAAQMPVDTEEGLRRALAQLRARGENLFGIKIMAALGAFTKSGATQLPATPAGLLPFFDPPIAPELLDRYEMLQAGPINALSERDAGMGIVCVKSPADIEYDNLTRTGTKGFSMENALIRGINDAQQQFSKANGGQKALTAAQLQPYFKWPVDPVVLEKRLAPRAPGAKP
jgi:RNA polymerase sigma factor (sigma-70 family)